MIKRKSYLSLLSLTLALSACGGGGGDQAAADQTAQADAQSLDSQLLSKPALTGQTKKNASSPTTTTTTPTDTSTTTSGSTTTTSTNTAALTYQQLLDDMTKPHEGYANGVSTSWAWGTGPVLTTGVNFPSSYTDPQLVPWGVAATDQAGSPARNTRIQIRKMILDVKRNGVWTRDAFNTTDSQIIGTLYTNYQTNTTAPANVRLHGSDGISVKLPDTGGSFHFYTANRIPEAFGAQEIVFRLEARLIVDDPTKPDDRASAKLLVNSAGDVWKSATATWNGVDSNVDVAIGRFKYVTNDWKSFSAHTMTTSTEINDYLAHEPSLSPR